MASTTFLSPVIRKLVDLLADEVNLVRGVHREAQSLKDELEIIQPFLRDAEAMSDRGEFSGAMKVWLKQLRDESENIEYIVDEYLYHLARHDHAQRGSFVGALHKANRCCRSLFPRHDIASKIRGSKVSLREIKERGQSFGLRPFEQGSSSTAEELDGAMDLRFGAHFIDGDELVGVDSMAKELVRGLVEDNTSTGLKVISLVGEGGIGKTTLAKKVYNDIAVKTHFNVRVWITVSRSYKIRKMLKVLKDQISPTNATIMGENWEVQDAISELRDYLARRSYMVVFDDVWKTDFWGAIKLAFPRNGKDNKIIFTTRNNKVATFFSESSCSVVQELKAWSIEQAWLLFCKKAFSSNQLEGRCPENLEQLSRKIVIKCQGLPLVIAAVAGSLSKKEKTEFEWQRVHDNLNFEFDENPKLAEVSKILSLSFHDLPYHLKPCFLYFGIFPEDFLILEEKLYEVWIAEGFIEPKRGKTLEQVAEAYLNELISRNLVSVEGIQRLGYQRWCRVHELIRDIILTKSNELCFAQFLSADKSVFGEEIRSCRLSINDYTKGALNLVRNSRTRSVFLFNVRELERSFVTGLVKTFKLLKVLDFENTPLEKLPTEVGNLFHLKSLNLRGTNVEKLPKSVGKLRNLQRLDVFDTLIRELPAGINKLGSLRSLQAYCRLDHKNERACSDKEWEFKRGLEI